MRTTCCFVASAADHARLFAAEERTLGCYEGRGLYNKKTGYPIDMPQREELCAPLVMKDVDEHITPMGEVVSSKSTRREVCKRHGWEPYEPLIPRGERETRPRGYTNKKFTKKRGLKTSEAAQEWLRNAHKKQAVKAGLAHG